MARDGKIDVRLLGGSDGRPGSTVVFDGRMHRHRTPTPVVFSNSGTPTAGTTSGPFIVDGAAKLVRFRVALGTAGSTSSTVELHVNGTSKASVTLAASTASGSATVSPSVALSDGDVLTVVPTTVGTGAAGFTAQAYLA